MTDKTPTVTEEEFLKDYKKGFQKKMPRGMREEMIAHMPREAGRTLVDNYYQWQKSRLALENQIRAIEQGYDTAAQIHPFSLTSLKMDLEALKAMETNARNLLKHYVESQPIGEWLLSIVGIGPVIAAAFLAHVDIRHAQNPGQIVRFAGMDPSRTWLSKKECAKLLEDFDWEASEDLETRSMTFDRVEQASGFKAIAMSRIWHKGFADLLEEKRVKVVKDFIKSVSPDPGQKSQLKTLLKGHSLPDFTRRQDVFSGVAGRDTQELENAFQETVQRWSKKTFSDRKTALSARLVMCPWNRTLKQTCFHATESFVKTQHTPGNVYFELFNQRLQRETVKNANLDYKDQAEVSLATKKFDKSKDAYKHYIEGKLPPGRLRRRAARWVMKILLGHLHTAWRQLEGLPVKEPYAISHLEDHSAGSKIPIPNQDLLDELLSRR